MKRILALVLAALLVFAFAACNSETEESKNESTQESAVVSTEESKTTEASSEAEASTEESKTTEESSEAETSNEESTNEESTDESTGEGETSQEDESGFESVIYDPLSIGKVKGAAPIVDGDVKEGEYATEIKFNDKKTHWNFDSTENADAYDVVLYMSWDETYLYTCVAVKVGKPRTYDNTDFTANRPYIFDRRHVMTAATTGDPIDAKYLPPNNDEAWDWGAAYNSKLGSEWSITAQPDGSNIQTDHFGAVTQSSGFEYIVAVSKMDTEYYEQRIPWSAIQGTPGFTAKAGEVIGYAFSCCCEEVDITVDTDENAIYACFGGGIIGGKNFSHYVGMTLKD